MEFYASVGRDDADHVTLVPHAVRSLALLALVTSAADAALLPLLPSISDDLDLSGVQAGALFTATTVAVVVAAVPVGQLGARHGAHLLLLAAAALVPVALLGMALAPGLPSLLAARVVLGLSFTVMWSLGPALAAARVPGARGTAPLIAASGIGWLIGPVVSGALAAALGWRAPLAILAAASLLAVGPFLRRGERESVGRPVPLRETFAIVRTSATAAWAAAICAVLGVITAATGILAPTVLAANGVGSAGIGLAVAASAVVWIVAAAGSGRIRRAWIDVRFVGAAMALLALCWALPVASLSSVAVVGFLLLTAACRALVNALLYPLGTQATHGEAGAAALVGLLNLAWAVPALVTPLLVGLAQEQGATRAVFAAVSALTVLVALGMLATPRPAAVAS